MSDLARVCELLREASKVLIFTGAGISTGSGIPDFRGPQGIWKKRQPVYYDEFLSDPAKRLEYWDYKLEGYEGFRDARPNAAHRALARLEHLGKLEGLVTQNIDGLHHLSGVTPERILEVHGTNRLVTCVDCRAMSDPAPAFEEFQRTHQPPRCAACGGWLKPATISFGQAMPEEVMQQAFELAARCDLALSLGSTLSVEPAAQVPMVVARAGHPYVVINQGPTAHDHRATVRLEGDLTELLPALLQLLEASP